MKLKLRSKRFDREYEIDAYIPENGDKKIILYHTALSSIFWNMSDSERPKIEWTIPDLRNLPGIPAMFVKECRMYNGSVSIQMTGEFTCIAWENSGQIKKENPFAICENRAFDKAFIKFMQFEVEGVSAIYSDA